MAARDEFAELTRDFMSLVDQTTVETPHFNTLAGELEVASGRLEFAIDN